jgi:hypothetical protein
VPITNVEITSLTYTLVPQNGGQTVILSYSDPDGNGGLQPTILIDTFQKNTNYNGVIKLYDESKNTKVEVTHIVEDIPEEYQFFYLPNDSFAIITYNDMDLGGLPIGLLTNFFTSEMDGNLRIILRKRPDKPAIGVSSGDIKNSGGVTEIDLHFPIIVQ